MWFHIDTEENRNRVIKNNKLLGIHLTIYLHGEKGFYHFTHPHTPSHTHLHPVTPTHENALNSHTHP